MDARTDELVRADLAVRDLRVLRVDLLGAAWVGLLQEGGARLERWPTAAGTVRGEGGLHRPPTYEERLETWADGWAVVLADCLCGDAGEPALRAFVLRLARDAEVRAALLAAEALAGMDGPHAIVFELLGGEPAALRAWGFRS